jgi:hypothetical protein
MSQTSIIIVFWLICLIIAALGMALYWHSISQEAYARIDCRQDCEDLVSKQLLDHATLKDTVCTCYWFEDGEYMNHVLLDPCDDPNSLACLPG